MMKEPVKNAPFELGVATPMEAIDAMVALKRQSPLGVSSFRIDPLLLEKRNLQQSN